MKYNYFYDGMAITKAEFLRYVPTDWEDHVDPLGEFSYGHYRAVQL